jgi:hypothetical protein
MVPARNLFERRRQQKEAETFGVQEFERLAADATSLEEMSAEFEVDPDARHRAEELGLEDVVQELEQIEHDAAELQSRTRRSIGERVGAWMKRSMLFKMALVSAALHAAPLSSTVRQVFSDVKEWIVSSEGAKEKRPGTVLRPQSYEEMLRVENETTLRKQRIKPEEVTEKKEAFRDRMARGEAISFEELYLDMEEVNGVPAENVSAAKQEAGRLVEKYAEQFGERIDAEELRGFVNDMYGPNENYDWGQGSVAEFFNTKKRNCLAVAKGQLVVLEGVISRLPREEQSRYTLGISKLHQHEIATVAVQGDDGVKTTYLLEGNVIERRGSEDIAGTKTVSLDTIKQGIVSEKPIHVQAKEGKDVNGGPDVIFSSNQPVDDGIIVEGDLAGSEYVLQEAAKQGVLPEVVQEIDPNREVEVTVEPEYIQEKTKEQKWIEEGKDPKAEKEREETAIHEGVDVAERIKRESLESAQRLGWGDRDTYLSVYNLTSPSVEMVHALAGLDPRVTKLNVDLAQPRVSIKTPSEESRWTPEAFRAIFDLPYSDISLTGVPDRLAFSLGDEKNNRSYRAFVVHTKTSAGLERVLNHLPNIEILGIVLDRSGEDPSEAVMSYWRVIAGLTYQRVGIYSDGFSHVGISKQAAEIIADIQSDLYIDTETLVQLFEYVPRTAHNRHFHFMELISGMDLLEERAPKLYRYLKKNAPEREDLLLPLKTFLEAAVARKGLGFERLSEDDAARARKVLEE